MLVHRALSICVAASAIAASGCSAGADDSADAEAHRPQGPTEEALAERFRSFARQLENADDSRLCELMVPPTAEQYGCDTGTPRLPKALRDLNVRTDEIYVYPDLAGLTLGARLGKPGLPRLFLDFKRTASGEWRLVDAAVGDAG